jgi:hypothetical protein
MRRAALLVAVLGAALATPQSALATDECNGLDVCISVPGPWVAVPGSASGRLRTVEYRLSCPRGSIVGGLDAVLGDRTLAVRFLGNLGSPVNPGITTERAVVFVATHARRAATVFRPVLGCIPTSGGGGRSTTATGAVAPRPVERLVRSVQVRVGERAALVVPCRAGERLVASSHAVTFRSRREPAARALAAVAVTRAERGNRVEVRARRGIGVPALTRVDVQVHAFCARGTP